MTPSSKHRADRAMFETLVSNVRNTSFQKNRHSMQTGMQPLETK